MRRKGEVARSLLHNDISKSDSSCGRPDSQEVVEAGRRIGRDRNAQSVDTGEASPLVGGRGPEQFAGLIQIHAHRFSTAEPTPRESKCLRRLEPIPVLPPTPA